MRRFHPLYVKIVGNVLAVVFALAIVTCVLRLIF